MVYIPPVLADIRRLIAVKSLHGKSPVPGHPKEREADMRSQLESKMRAFL